MARKIISSYRAKTKVKRRKHSKNASKGQIGYKKDSTFDTISEHEVREQQEKYSWLYKG